MHYDSVSNRAILHHPLSNWGILQRVLSKVFRRLRELLTKAIHLSLEASKVFGSPGSCMDGVPPCLRGEAPIEMEAVAPGEDQYYLYHKPLSARPLFYDDNFEQPDVSQGFTLPDSGDGYGSYQRTDVQPVDGDRNGFFKPSISVSSKDPMYNARDTVDANGYSFAAAGEVSQRLACDSDSKRDIVIGKHAPVPLEKSDNLYQSDAVNTMCIGEVCRSSCKPDDKDQVLNSIGTADIKDEEDYDVDNAQEIPGNRIEFPGNRIVPLESHIRTEILEFNASQCYSPGEWSSHVSTDSPVSTSASPLPAGSLLPVFNRCKTAPIGGASSSHVDMEERRPNFTRSKTDKEKKPKLAETLLHAPSPAEKLSERKRVWAPNTWCLGVMFWSLRSSLAEASYYCWLLRKIIENLVRIKNDGTVEVDVDRGSEFAPALFDLDVPDQAAASIEEDFTDPTKVIPAYLEIAMLIVGTRGDVQPFVAIGKRLKEKGHRVRLATHANFRTFVTSNGLEFYPLGGDPKILAGYMVKNKGFLPSGPSELSIQRKQLKAIMNSLLPACTKEDGESGAPFRADAIIANPPAYGHIHVAECLDVPIHIFFTMPWTPTNEFPHPLARVKQQAGYKLSYHVVDSLMWWGIRGLINEFRVKELNLNPMNYFNMSQESIAHLPTGYMWSPLLVPKPKDWGPRVDVVGFCFLNLANDYKPPDDLVKWLAAGEKPIYVGFGSIPLEQPGKMTEIIIQALQETKQRGIIDKGWGGLGNLKEIPDSIFLLENCPHDWLFPQCAAVVHHGGAGTTAAGLKAGCPTTIVPFFGDQPFWGERVCAKGVGPPPVPVQQFSLERLVHAINFIKDSEVKQRALELAKQMEEEDGVEGAVDAFYRHWVKGPPQGSFTAQPPSFIQAILIRLQKFWCLPCCFE